MFLPRRRRPTRSPRMAAVAFSLFLALPALFLPSIVQARGQLDLPWPLAQLFGVALRFVRVDRGCRVVDKDENAAYIAFECESEPDKKRGGSLELIPLTVQGRSGVRAQISLADETHGTELRFLELLERKIREEKGPPPPPGAPRPAPPPAHAPDGGAQ